jgi:hypothetical protein
MTLMSAISILARVHTREDTEPFNFQIIVGATPRDSMAWGVSEHDYVEAWRVVRENAGLMPEKKKDDRE